MHWSKKAGRMRRKVVEVFQSKKFLCRILLVKLPLVILYKSPTPITQSAQFGLYKANTNPAAAIKPMVMSFRAAAPAYVVAEKLADLVAEVEGATELGPEVTGTAA